MRRNLLLFLFCMLFLGMWADPIDKNAAYRKAAAFMNNRGVAMPKTGTMAYSLPGKNAASSNSLYYVFNVGNNKGFVIVAGDDAVSPILGYTDSGTFDSKQLPDNAKAMLDSYAEQIEAIQQNPSLLAAETSSHDAISPLIQTKWNQSAPYNYSCPVVANETDRSVTGCVATAMAQVMYYHKWPNNETKEIPSYTYIYRYNSIRYVTIDGEEPTTFNWDAMRSTYTGSEAEDDASAHAVAELMVYAGKSVEMNYSKSSSGAATLNAISSLQNYFDYDDTMHSVDRGDYSSAEWEAVIYNELVNERPVIFSASAVSQSVKGGHAFICDGYDGNGLYHINWGWGGQSDGYFMLSLLNPPSSGIGGNSGSGGYSFDQQAIIGIQPNDGNEDTMPMALSTDMLETTSESATRTDASQGFSLPVTYRLINNTGYDVTFDGALGIYDTDGQLSNTISLRSNYPLSNSSSTKFQQSLTFGKDLSDGLYHLKLVSRFSDEAEWQMVKNADSYYIVATIEGNTVTYKNVSISPEITINEVTIEGNKKTTSAQKISVNLTNTGSTYTHELYLYINGNRQSGIGVNIDPGTSADYTFDWTPSSVGTYTITLTDDADGATELYSETVEIEDAVETRLSFAYKIDNAKGSVVSGNTLSGTMTVTNEMSTEYYDNVYLYLYWSSDGYLWSRKTTEAKYVQLNGNETKDLSFQFTDLDVSKQYFIRFLYNKKGALYYTDNNWYTLEDNASSIGGVELDANDDEQPIYNLNGVRMPNGSSLPKGIYIKGGKKIVVK